jgi:hypothetical protein
MLEAFFGAPSTAKTVRYKYLASAKKKKPGLNAFVGVFVPTASNV